MRHLSFAVAMAVLVFTAPALGETTARSGRLEEPGTVIPPPMLLEVTMPRIAKLPKGQRWISTGTAQYSTDGARVDKVRASFVPKDDAGRIEVSLDLVSRWKLHLLDVAVAISIDGKELGRVKKEGVAIGYEFVADPPKALEFEIQLDPAGAALVVDPPEATPVTISISIEPMGKVKGCPQSLLGPALLGQLEDLCRRLE